MTKVSGNKERLRSVLQGGSECGAVRQWGRRPPTGNAARLTGPREPLTCARMGFLNVRDHRPPGTGQRDSQRSSAFLLVFTRESSKRSLRQGPRTRDGGRATGPPQDSAPTPSTAPAFRALRGPDSPAKHLTSSTQTPHSHGPQTATFQSHRITERGKLPGDYRGPCCPGGGTRCQRGGRGSLKPRRRRRPTPSHQPSGSKTAEAESRPGMGSGAPAPRSPQTPVSPTYPVGPSAPCLARSIKQPELVVAQRHPPRPEPAAPALLTGPAPPWSPAPPQLGGSRTSVSDAPDMKRSLSSSTGATRP